MTWSGFLVRFFGQVFWVRRIWFGSKSVCMKHRAAVYRAPGESKRREVELDPQVSSEEILSREVELCCES